MTFHLYAKADGFPDITNYLLDLNIFPGYIYLGEQETLPDVAGKRYVHGEWVPVEPTYIRSRRKAYPPAGELFDALWHAMDAGILPKVEGFYDKMDEVKKRFPKP